MAVTTNYTLLPPNATPLERALEIAMRPAADALAGVQLVATAKEVLPDGWPMFLVWEYGLEELLPYLPDPRVIIVTGLQWQRLQGTPASLRMALEWLGLDASIEQEDPLSTHWFEYQIDPGKIPSRAEMQNIVGLAKLSAPVGTRLSRLFHGYDRRRAVYDFVSWDDGSLYDANSGIYDPNLDVDLSFGRDVITYAGVGDLVPALGLLLEYATFTPYDDRLLWDYATYDGGAGATNFSPAVYFEMVSAAAAGIPPEQADVFWVTRPRAIEEYGWGEATWGARTWTQPAVSP